MLLDIVGSRLDCFPLSRGGALPVWQARGHLIVRRLDISWATGSSSFGKGGCETNYARSSYINKFINDTSQNNIVQSTRHDD
jgi:hypothetical protein